MRILFLTQIIPYPLDAGPKVKTWNVIRHLHEAGHEVVLASFVREEEKKHVAAMQSICSEVHTVSIKRSRLADIAYLIKSQVSGRPFLIERDDLPEMRALIKSILNSQSIDAMHADQLTMAQFAFGDAWLSQSIISKQPFLIFDAHNAVWTIVERSRQTSPWFLKPILQAEMKRVTKYEARILEAFDHITAVAKPDVDALMKAVNGNRDNLDAIESRISTIPIAVDTHELQPLERESDGKSIVTLGSLHYPPNADGVIWFVRDVLPLILSEDPHISLTIIGKNPPQSLLKVAQAYPKNVLVTGYVPDIVPYLREASVLVIPVRAGGGMRVRILEGFSRAMPMVTTTIGLEGIDAVPGRDILVEDTAQGFARATLDLLKNRHQQSRLGENGRRLATTRYDWQVVLKQLDKIYEMAVKARQPH